MQIKGFRISSRSIRFVSPANPVVNDSYLDSVTAYTASLQGLIPIRFTPSLKISGYD